MPYKNRLADGISNHSIVGNVVRLINEPYRLNLFFDCCRSIHISFFLKLSYAESLFDQWKLGFTKALRRVESIIGFSMFFQDLQRRHLFQEDIYQRSPRPVPRSRPSRASNKVMKALRSRGPEISMGSQWGFNMKLPSGNLT